MKLIVRIFDNSEPLLKGEFKIRNNFYIATENLAGSVVEIKEDDDWLDGELGWVSRSEIPFITAIRLAQVSDNPDGNIWGRDPTPIITKFGDDHGVSFLSRQKEYDNFPSRQKCIELIKEKSEIETKKYIIENKKISRKKILNIFKQFDYYDDLLIRAGTCLHKAHTLERVSYIFSEEIYNNLFISFEAIIEYLKQLNGTTRGEVLKAIELRSGSSNFLEYEEEMRDEIRNNIIHPWRDVYKESVVQPMVDIDYIFEDLPFVDWLFRQVILDKIFD